MGIPLHVMHYSLLFLGAFNISSLHLIFVSLINMCLGVFLLGTVCHCLHFLDLAGYFLSPSVRETSYCNLFQHFPRLLLFLSFFCDPDNSNVGAFNIPLEVSWVCCHFLRFSLSWSAAPTPQATGRVGTTIERSHAALPQTRRTSTNSHQNGNLVDGK